MVHLSIKLIRSYLLDQGSLFQLYIGCHMLIRSVQIEARWRSGWSWRGPFLAKLRLKAIKHANQISKLLLVTYRIINAYIPIKTSNRDRNITPLYQFITIQSNLFSD